MPQGLIPTITSYVGALTGSSLIATAVAHVTVAAITMVGANLLAPKVDFGNVNTRRSLNVRGRNQRNATSSRQYVYGEVAVGGTIAYMGTSGTENEFLHMVLVHCDHEVESLGDLYVNGEVVEMASGSEGTLRTTSSSSNRYYQSLYIADHLGGPSQTSADSTLDAAMGQIYSSDAFKGMAYTYIRMELKQPTENDDTKNAFSAGVPQFQRVVQGMKVYDPREAGHDPDDSTTWEYSNNWALCVAHFLQSGFGYGRYGLTYDEINETELIASANDAGTTINELWTNWAASTTLDRAGYTRAVGSTLLYALTAGTTGTSTPDVSGVSLNDLITDNDITWRVANLGIATVDRYQLDGMVDALEDPIEVLRKMKTAGAGVVEFIGGEWIIRSGRYTTPTVTLSESDFTSGISGTTKDDRSNAVNTVKGVVVDKHDFYNVIDAPSITNSTFVTQDGGIESVKEMELLFTNSHKTAQRLFKIELNKSRQSITHSATFTSKAMQLQVGDNFKLNFDQYGYSEKVFQVWSHQLVINGGALEVNMEFREVASDMFDWDHTTDETALDPAPNTTLPSAFEVVAPTNLATASGTAQLVNRGGDVFSRMKLSWDLAEDSNVIAHEIIHRKREYRSIDGITQANPAVVTTATDHDFVAGDIITMWQVSGMTEVIGVPYTVANPTADTFELSGIDSTGFTAYSAGSDWVELDWENVIYAPVPTSSIIIPDVEDGAGYDFKVRAVNTVTKSDWVALDNQVVIGKTAVPVTPVLTSATAGVEQVTLAIVASTEADFKTFKIYQHTSAVFGSAAEVAQTSDNFATITGLAASTTYHFWVKAVDTSGLVSAESNSVNATPTATDAGDVTNLGDLAIVDSIDLGTEGSGGVTTGTILPTGNTDATDNGDTIDTSGNVNNAIDFTASGAIKHGKTSSDDSTNAGFWLGEDGQVTPDYDFHIGNSTNSLKWDGSASTLTVKGDLSAGSVDIGTSLQRTQIDSDGTSSWGSGRIQINASDSFFGDVGQKWLGSAIESIWIDCNTTLLPAALNFGNTSTGATNAKITGQGNAEFKTLDVTTSLDLNSSTLDASNGVGSAGQVLSSQGTYTQWIDAAAGQWTVSGSDVYYNTGNVGIGTDSPDELLHVKGGSDRPMVVESTDAFCFISLNDNSTSAQSAVMIGAQGDDLRIDAGDSERIRVGANGNVGIGTSSPSQSLDVYGASQISYGGVDTYQYFQSTSNYVGRDTSGDFNVGVAGSQSILFKVGDAEKMRLSSDGKLGIGETSPDEKLHIKDTASTFILLERAANSDAAGIKFKTGGTEDWRIGSGDSDYVGDGSSFAISTAYNQPKFVIDSSGNVGVKNPSPSAALDVTGELELSSHATLGSNLYLKRDSDAWTTTTTWLNVSDYGVLNTGGSYALTLNGNGYRNNSGGWTSFGQNSLNGASQIWQYPAGYMTFNANSSWTTGSSTVVSERMRIFGDGNVSIGTTSSGYKLRVEGTQYIADTLTLGDVGSEGGQITLLDHNNTSTNQLVVDVDAAGNGRVFNAGNGNLKLGNLTFGTGETQIYCNADLKIQVKSTQTVITDQLYVSGATGSDSIVTISGIDCGGGMLVQGSLDVDSDLSVAGSKNFRIAHPIRDGHDLMHTCVESPQADLTYRGKATLVDGTVEVDLDSEFGMTAGTFAVLNDDVQVFAQNDTGWDAVRGSVTDGVLTINCQNLESTDSVGWLVIGRRTDVEIEIEPKTKTK